MIVKLISGLAFVLALCFTACHNEPTVHFKHDPNYVDRYACPMNCEKGKTYAQPGECPVCHMKLKPKEVRVEDLNREPDTVTHQ